jgi:putative transposase
LPENFRTMKIEYNNIYIHFVFTTMHRQPLIPEKSRIRIEKYITGIVTNHGSKLYAIYANPDHVHFLVSRDPSLSDTKLATIIADSSEKFINENNLATGSFAWQQSASAFSVSKSEVDKICKYILNQPAHHKKVTWNDEYQSFIKHYQSTIKD